MGKNELDFSKEYGWTNFTMCFTEEVEKIMQELDKETLEVCTNDFGGVNHYTIKDNNFRWRKL